MVATTKKEKKMTKKDCEQYHIKCRDCGKEQTEYEYFQYTGLRNNHGGFITPPRILCKDCFDKQARLDELFEIKDSIYDLKKEVRLNMSNCERERAEDKEHWYLVMTLFVILQLAILWLSYSIF